MIFPPSSDFPFLSLTCPFPASLHLDLRFHWLVFLLLFYNLFKPFRSYLSFCPSWLIFGFYWFLFFFFFVSFNFSYYSSPLVCCLHLGTHLVRQTVTLSQVRFWFQGLPLHLWFWDQSFWLSIILIESVGGCVFYSHRHLFLRYEFALTLFVIPNNK